ncbi:FG-GAP-like repeat-containing protein [Roseiconus lacunae]|uniref:FG-GAP-like repeat-containing protein n=1 Tax=Roseiconus lacunae TaxID=2605694 RepID=UPI0011F24068|nr:FG-GAP-like repeat-containing protein [Roseiconus lacunae]
MTLPPAFDFRIPTLVAVSLIVTFAGCDSSQEPSTPTSAQPSSATPSAKEDEMMEARRMVSAENWQMAGNAAIKVLLRDPGNEEAILIAAESALRQNNNERAAELAASIAPNSPLAESGTDILAQALFQLGRASEAADTLLEGIEKRPKEWVWYHRAWGLLSRVGRREEASSIAEKLCLAGEATETELNSLIRRTQSFPTVVERESLLNRYFEPGLGMARWHFTQLEYRQALDELAPEFKSGFTSIAASALYGRLLAETQSHDKFPPWHATCDLSKIAKFGDYWAAVGTYFFDTRQFESSARALLNAVYLNPTDRSSMQRLAKVFDALGNPEQGQQYRVRGIDLAHCETTSDQLQQQNLTMQDHLQLRHRIMQQLLELERPFEVLGWAAHIHATGTVAKQREIARKREELRRTDGLLTLARDASLIGEKREDYELGDAYKELVAGQNQSQVSIGATEITPIAKPRLVNVAKDVNLDFQWYRSFELDDSPIPIHESIGGAIAVLDYDLDGWPDIYFAQGSGEPPSNQCTRSNVLVRNFDGSFADETDNSLTSDFNYGSGLAAGDVNQDGFPDLFVGSLGKNRLLINNGDGTYQETPVFGGVADRFTSSIGIADINGDNLPDLFEGIYIEMEGAFALPKIGANGVPEQPSPLEHYAQSDRWYVNRGDGQFTLQDLPREVARPGTSLGLVITNFDRKPGNEVFVGNDVRPNHFLIPQGDDQLANAADAQGIANGFEGAANGCMGIATGDFNRDGTFDMYITNFSEESANLYLQSEQGGFTDFAIRYKLDQPSLPMVGFGTKAVDFDRDGWLDFAVTNGHIFDMSQYGDLYQMPPQILMNHGTEFRQTEVDDPTAYFEGKYLGRSMATIDYDRDGVTDLLINHMDQPVALLHNETPTPGRALQIELIGTVGERDAIGAKVTARWQDQSKVAWVTAGDGYLCSDEPVLELTFGNVPELDQVDVQWPSGETQTFPGPIQPGRFLAIEGQPELFPR